MVKDPLLKMMTYKVDNMLGRVESNPVYDQLKLYIHDMHDTTMLIMLAWLNASNLIRPQPTRYASQISYELLYSEKCLAARDEIENPEECFSVVVTFDNKVLEFEDICAEPALCTWPEFIHYVGE